VAIDSKTLALLVDMVQALTALQALLSEQLSLVQRQLGVWGEKREREDPSSPARPATKPRVEVRL
jgi:hypothetical protein